MRKRFGAEVLTLVLMNPSVKLSLYFVVLFLFFLFDKEKKSDAFFMLLIPFTYCSDSQNMHRGKLGTPQSFFFF